MTHKTVVDRDAMVANMAPSLVTDTWRIVRIEPANAATLLGEAIATFRETEGVSAIVPASLADECGQTGPDFRQITLQVHSDLEGVGLTAAVSGALADQGIACNVVAAFHHDHIFVPASDADRAMEVLNQLSSTAGGRS